MPQYSKKVIRINVNITATDRYNIISYINPTEIIGYLIAIDIRRQSETNVLMSPKYQYGYSRRLHVLYENLNN